MAKQAAEPEAGSRCFFRISPGGLAYHKIILTLQKLINDCDQTSKHVMIAVARNSTGYEAEIVLRTSNTV